MSAKLNLCAGPGKRAMLRVEQAISDARFGRTRLDMSCGLVGEALALEPAWSSSLGLRLDEWVARVRSHVAVPEVREMAGRVREWQRSGT